MSKQIKGPFAFSAIRNYIGVFTLIPVIFVIRRTKKGKSGFITAL